MILGYVKKMQLERFVYNIFEGSLSAYSLSAYM